MTTTSTHAPWLSVHVHCHSAVAQDSLLLRLADALDVRGHEWFFVRYWLHGPHLRVRVRDADAVAVVRRASSEFFAGTTVEDVSREAHYARVPTALREGVVPEEDAVWHGSGVVVDATYEREVERYGGQEAMPTAEEAFVASTRFCVLAVRGTRTRAARAVAAGRAMQRVVDACGLTDRFSRYGSFWDATTDSPRPDLVLTRAVDVVRGAAAMPPLDAAVDDLADVLTGLPGGWSDDARALVVASQVHMTNNRLGVPVSWEAALGRLLWRGDDA